MRGVTHQASHCSILTKLDAAAAPVRALTIVARGPGRKLGSAKVCQAGRRIRPHSDLKVVIFIAVNSTAATAAGLFAGSSAYRDVVELPTTV